MRIAFVGCGYVADLYIKTLSFHPDVELVGVYDQDPQRLANFSTFYSVDAYRSFDELIDDERVDIVVNLTNPASHYEISKAGLMAGKHVYTEKPLALTFAEATDLVELARQHNLYLSSAPCSLLGEPAQTIWKALRDGEIGKAYLAYAELDDGMIHLLFNPKGWKSKSGTPWPYKNEFETGCTMEHAGYYLTWLTAFFGPAKTITAFSSCLIPDKADDVRQADMAPDFTVGCIEFESGVVARLTCSIVADRDRSLTIVGEKGILNVDDCWAYRAPVSLKKRRTRKSWIQTNRWVQSMQRHIPVVKKIFYHYLYTKGYHHYEKPVLRLVSDPTSRPQQKHALDTMDFIRGISELSSAILEGRPCRLSAEHALHVTELTLALQSPQEMGTPYHLTTTFSQITPMAWAQT
jgi:predicted dehydrogenase